jgi:mono/diheme cytochrome c family protein
MLSCKKQRSEVRSQKSGELNKISPRLRVSASPCLLLVLLTPFCLLLTGCRRDMQDQPRMKPYRANALHRQKPLIEGTVPRGYLRENREFFSGKKLKAGDLSQEQQYQRPGQATTPAPGANAFPDDVETIPMTITKADLDRGQERYNIYCSVCHGMTGYGDGIVARRGFNRPSPASYHQDRLRQAPVGHFFDVMTNGWGAMPSYASQVPVEDRWRIAAYVRALQLSQMKGSENPTASSGGNPTVREGATQH